MVEQFSSFVQEALEFLSLLRASEKERFEIEKKFMTETTKILKDLAESITKNNSVIKATLDDLKKSVNGEIKRIEDKIGITELNEAIKALESAVNLLQRGSTILDYKFTIQKTREMLDDLKKTTFQVPGPASVKTSASAPKELESKAVTPKESAPQISKPIIVSPPAPSPPPPPSSTARTAPSVTTPISKSRPPSPPAPGKSSPHETENDTKPTSSVASMMGTRPDKAKDPRRAVTLKKTLSTKIVESDDGAIEIETRSDEDK